MKLKVLALLLLLGVAGVSPRSFGQLASPYSNSVWPAQTFTASSQTGATIQLNGLVVSSTVGSSFASGTVTVTGTSLTTVTFAVMGSSDNGATFYALPIYTVASPSTTPTTTITATANGIYQVSLAGLTHIKFVTSGTFTATAVSIVLTASPNAGISKGASSSSLPTATAQGQAPVYNGSAYTAQAVPVQDTRPRATTSAVGIIVAANSSCLISVSPATSGLQSIGSCVTGQTPTGPGTITHIHLTLGSESGDGATIMQKSTLTFNCDGTTQIVPLSLFFLSQDNPIPFSDDWIDNTLGASNSGNFSSNRRMELNFASGCQVTFNNASTTNQVDLFSEVDYRLGANVSRPSRQYWHAFVQPLTSIAAYANFPMLPTARDVTGGELESMTLYASNSANSYYLEGYTTVTIDGNPAVQANGTEDFFGSGYYAINAVGGHHSSKWGEFYSSNVGANPSLQNPAGLYDVLLYRNFQTEDRENALFTNNLAVFQPNGQFNKPGPPPSPGTSSMASLVTFWTHDPMAQTPTFSPTAGAVTSGTTVTISSATSGATICNSTTSTAPASNGAGTCTAGTTGASVVVTSAETIQALASKSGFADSFIASAAYTLLVPYVSPIFRSSCSNAVSSGNTTAVSCTLTPTAGDFAFVMCTNGNSSGGFTATSSPSAGYAQMSALNSPSGSNQAAYAFGLTGSSTTFTCTAPSYSYQGIIVLDYAPGSVTSLVAGSPNYISTATANYVSSAATTSSSAFFIACAHPHFGPPSGTPGNINGSAATGRTMLTSDASLCEDLSVTGAATGATATLTGSASGAWDGVIAAFQ